MPNVNNQKASWFTYAAEFINLAVNQATTVRVQIAQESDFVWTQLTGDVRATDDTQGIIANPAILVDFNLNDRDLMSAPVRWESIVGDAKEPYILTTPEFLPRSSVLEVVLTQGNVGAVRQARLYLHGYKVR